MRLGLLVLATSVAPAIVFAQDGVGRFEITGTGEMGGNAGYFMEFTIDDTLNETEFLFEEGQHIRFYAFRMEDEDWQVLPPGTYACKRLDISVGDSWTSTDGDGPTTVTVVDSVEISVVAGSFACFVGESRRQGDSFLVQKWWWSQGVGWVQLWHYQTGLHGLTSYHVESGQENSFLPLAVGNWWEFEEMTAVKLTTWGATKALYGGTP